LFVSEELSEAKMVYNSYMHMVDDINQQLVDNAAELEVLQVKEANAKETESILATGVRCFLSTVISAL
jgi:hypothetical protein